VAYFFGPPCRIAEPCKGANLSRADTAWFTLRCGNTARIKTIHRQFELYYLLSTFGRRASSVAGPNWRNFLQNSFIDQNRCFTTCV